MVTDTHTKGFGTRAVGKKLRVHRQSANRSPVGAAPASLPPHIRLSLGRPQPLSERNCCLQPPADATIHRRQQSMRITGLFAGVGGLEVGLHEAGHSTVLFCEIDPAARSVLQAHFPGVELADDVRTMRKLPKDTELLAGGFPCQDISQAGKTQGLSGKNSGLVNEVFRLLRGNDVPHVLLENVSFIRALGKGQVMRHITSALEELGYRWAYRVVDTRAFGLPQRRQRLFLLASRVIEPFDVLMCGNLPDCEPEDWQRHACGFYWTEGIRGLGWAVGGIPTLKGGSTIGIPSCPAIWFRDGTIGTPDIRDAERLQGFVPDWTQPAEKVARGSMRWKLVGNAVSVPVAAWIGNGLAGKTGRLEFLVHDFDVNKMWPIAAFGGPRTRPLEAVVSMFPDNRSVADIADFLAFPVKPLSQKATTGFLARLRSSSLRYPREFLCALEAHAEKMRGSNRLAVA